MSNLIQEDLLRKMNSYLYEDGRGSVRSLKKLTNKWRLYFQHFGQYYKLDEKEVITQ